jgi:hypothetical protein
MIPWTVLAGVAVLWLGLWLAVRARTVELRIPIMALEIMAGVVAKLALFQFRDAYQLAWLTWRLLRMDRAQLTYVLVAVETRRAVALATRSTTR